MNLAELVCGDEAQPADLRVVLLLRQPARATAARREGENESAHREED
jgi:hypothetical protein